MKTDTEIIDELLSKLPVGYLPNHHRQNLVELVMYHVERSGILGSLEDKVIDEFVGR